MRYIEGVHRKRKISFPEYIDDYITEENSVRVMDVFIDTLDIVTLGFRNAAPAAFGRPGYDPRMMLKLYLYGYMNGITSSRKLERETTRNIELIWLLRKLSPDHKVISDFRKDNEEAIRKVFKQFVALCKSWDLFGMEIVAVDGSKFRASNSKKNNFDKKNLVRKIKHLDEQIQKYMSQINENDDCEETSRELSIEEIKEKIWELKSRKEKYEAYQQEIKEKDISEISTTDPDARRMATNNNGLDMCYNVQTVVDSKHSLIVDCDVINNPADQGQLSKMAKAAKEIFEVEELKALADKGYYNAEDLKECAKESITTYVSKQVFANSTGEREFYLDKFQYDKEENIYICPAGEKLYCIRKKPIDENTKHIVYKNEEACSNCKLKNKCTKSESSRLIKRSVEQDFLDVVDERTKENKALYKTRQMIVEHPFGTIKRGWGLTYFQTRGIKSVKTEITMAFLAYNMKRVINIIGIKEMIRRLTGKNIPVNLYRLNFSRYFLI